MLIPEKQLEGDENIHHVTNSDTKTEIKIVLCSHHGTQIILSVNLIEAEICPIYEP